MKLSSARVLLTNDDGIEAEGLKILEKSVKSIVGEVWIVAPELEQSASSHSLTIRRPLRIRQLSERRFAVDGTPSDSVLLAVSEVMRDKPPDLILSGINRGGNLGYDITYSGTVGAAIEGTLLGIDSIALSQVYCESNAINWGTGAYWVKHILEYFTRINLPKGVLMNVNFPPVRVDAVSGIEAVSQGCRKIGGELQSGVDPRGTPYFWIGPQREDNLVKQGTDLEAVSRGAISVTPLSLNLTHTLTLKKMKDIAPK